MNLNLVEIESQTPGENPFREDAYHMGIDFAKDWVIMHPQHPSQEFSYCIFVHIPTGKRYRIQTEETE